MDLFFGGPSNPQQSDSHKKWTYFSAGHYLVYFLPAYMLPSFAGISPSRLAVKPCRIAFDALETKDAYFSALNAAVDSGIRHFSNYLLFNYKETPQDLWTRLFLNVEFCQRRNELLTLFSFPMKYASIEHTDRNYIGRYWNKKYLRSINVILNVTNGIVAKEMDFFVRAFGQNEEEFLEILIMPDDFIRYRDYFDQYKFVQKWLYLYRGLTEDEKQELLNILSNVTTETLAPDLPHSGGLNIILQFYGIKKNKMENNRLYYTRKFEDIPLINDISVRAI